MERDYRQLRRLAQKRWTLDQHPAPANPDTAASMKTRKEKQHA
jgi:hypothetical protein